MGGLVSVDMIYDWASYGLETEDLCGISMGLLAVCWVMISFTIF